MRAGVGALRTRAVMVNKVRAILTATVLYLCFDPSIVLARILFNPAILKWWACTLWLRLAAGAVRPSTGRGLLVWWVSPLAPLCLYFSFI